LLSEGLHQINCLEVCHLREEWPMPALALAICQETGSDKGVARMSVARLSFIALLAFFLLLQSLARADSEQDKNPAVTVRESDGVIIVDVALSVPATRQESWRVLTDFDHMAQFISTLQSSKVIARSGDKVQVAQQGHASHGPLSFTFDSVREITLKPYEEIRSRIISGSMKKLDGVTHLATDDAGTRIVYHGESISGAWVPPGIGPALIENEIRGQYDEMRKEILRRKASEKK
jgi:hypothetical protein